MRKIGKVSALLGLVCVLILQLVIGASAITVDTADPLMTGVFKTVLDFEGITTGVRLGVDETTICPSNTRPAAVANGTIVLQAATGSSLDNGTWLKYTVNGATAGASNNVPLRMDKFSSATVDWSGAEGYVFYLDTTEMKDKVDTVTVSIPFSESNAGNYEYWIPVAGATVYVENAGEWKAVQLTATGSAGLTGVASAANQSKVGELVLDAGFKGWVKVPLDADTYQPLRSVQNGTMNLNAWLFFQPYVSVAEGGYGQSVYFDQFMLYRTPVTGSLTVSGAFGNDMILQQNQSVVVKGTASAGEEITVTLKKDNGGLVKSTATVAADVNGDWKATLEGQAGGYDTYTLTAATAAQTKTFTNVVFGEVWVAGGQSNMWWTVESSAEAFIWQSKPRHDAIRIYLQSTSESIGTVLTSPQGTWHTAGTWDVVKQCSAVAYYFAEKVYAQLDMPVGIINTAVAGTSIVTWIGEDAYTAHADYKSYLISEGYTYASGQVRGALAGYYNSRIAPFRDTHVAGVIWYQGEGDRGRPAVLKQGLPILWENWCDVFDNDALPFFSVQLAAYTAELAKNVSTPNFAMAEAMETINQAGGIAAAIPLYDVEVNTGEIHPTHKQPVGERLATVALGKVYATEPTLCDPPTVTSVVKVGNAITLTFDPATVGTGLKLLRGSSPAGFAVRKNGVFVDAPATVTADNAITVSLAGIEGGTGLYYAYGDSMMTANIANSADLPMMPMMLNQITKVLGDVTGDGKVSTRDVRAILRHVVSKETLSAEAQALANVDGNDVLNVMDARRLLQFLVGKAELSMSAA